MTVGISRVGVFAAVRKEPQMYVKLGKPVEGTGRVRRRDDQLEIEVIDGRHRTWTPEKDLTPSGSAAMERLHRAHAGKDLDE